MTIFEFLDQQGSFQCFNKNAARGLNYSELRLFPSKGQVPSERLAKGFFPDRFIDGGGQVL